MRLTHLADYAVVMMTAAARAPEARWSAAALAAETGVPQATAQKLMQMLARADLITGQRGANGGYSLSRPIEDISLADIIEAVEGPIAMTQCSDGSSDCALDANCRIKPHMGLVGQKVRGALGAVSLQELTQ
ncbi:SUF system Fe-S cluster assembly regulator [Sphingomicrobium sp. XHP0235]|uniref:SUF system Fe-S cluster assembly regulator n=1 Tax=Sphingomicrobium aquimarinum TaxID=3133971 RepID=UPI0031FE7B2D